MKESNDSKKSSALNRREFISGLMASIGLSATESMAGAPETSPRPPERLRQGPESTEAENLKEVVYNTYRPMFDRVAEHSELLYTDVHTVLDRSKTLAEDFTEYDSLFSLVRTELSLSSIPEPTQSAVRDSMTFVPYVESRLDAEAVSPRGAFGVMQLMPSTWDELAREGERADSVIDQVRVAGRLLEQTYRYIMQRHAETFDLITEVVFTGDADRCAKEFVNPMLVAAYFCGMGTVSNALDGFVHDYVDVADIETMRQQGIVDEEYGVYSLYSRAGEVHGYDKDFGPESATYFPKVLAAHMSVRINLTATQYDTLLHGQSNTT